MYVFEMSPDFREWLANLKDKPAKARVRSAELGNMGDCSPVGEGVSEMRIHSGPGYRLHFKRRGDIVYILLAGGDRSTQKRDIKRALELARAV